MFSVDHASVGEPYLGDSRAFQLQELSQRPFHCGPADPDEELESYGLKFVDLVLKAGAQPQLKWTHWRWPRHEYSRGDFEDYPDLKLTIQWMVQEGTVLQQCLLESEDGEFEFDVEFSKSMIIRDLDYIDDSSKFNEERTRDQDTTPGPRGYGWVCVRKLAGTMHDSETTEPLFATPEEHLPSPCQSSIDGRWMEPSRKPGHGFPDHGAESKKPYAVSVICSVAINGEVQLFMDDTSPQKWRLQGISPEPKKPDGRPKLCEIITAYELRLLDEPKTNWKSHIIPWQKMRVSEFLRKHTSASSLPALVLRQCRHSTPDMLQEGEELSNIGTVKDSGDTIANPIEHNEAGAPEPTQMQGLFKGHEVETPGKSSAPKGLGVSRKHLDFAARRNLEHILSVCAIQATRQPPDTSGSSSISSPLDDVEAVALTCGDMSGHRICWSASL